MLRYLNISRHGINSILLQSNVQSRLSPIISSNVKKCHPQRQPNVLISQVRCFSINQMANDWNSFLTNSPAVISCQETLVQLHEYTGLPWYAQIMACGVLLRTALLPLAVYERKQQAKYENLGPLLQKHAAEKMEQLKLLVAKREIPSDEARTRLRREMYLKRKELIIQFNVHPFKRVIVVLFQLPIWLMMSCALGNLCLRSPFIEDNRIVQIGQTVRPQLQGEGTLWFTDLTQNDPTMILPLLFGTLFLANVLHADLLRKQNDLEPSAFGRHFSTFLKFFTLFVVYAAESVPTALTLYWCSSFMVGLTQNILFSYPAFRRLCNIPRTPRELKPVQMKLDLLFKK